MKKNKIIKNLKYYSTSDKFSNLTFTLIISFFVILLKSLIYLYKFLI